MKQIYQVFKGCMISGHFSQTKMQIVMIFK